MYILFDNDGTLYDTAGVSVPAVQEAFQELKTRHDLDMPIPNETTIKEAFGLPLPGYAEYLLPEGKKKLAWDLVNLAHVGERARLLAGKGKLYPGIGDLLEDLRGAGWKMAIVSNCDRKYMNLIWETFNYQEFFQTAVCHGDHPEDTKDQLMARALLKLGLEPKENHAKYSVGDRFHDIQGGMANDLHTVFCGYGFGHPKEGEGASFLARSPQDIHKWLFSRHPYLRGPALNPTEQG